MSIGSLAQHAEYQLAKEATKEDDMVVFERLFERYSKRVYNLIYRMVGNESDAADLTQEVFVRIYNSLHQVRSEEVSFAWIRTVAINITRDHFRKIGRTIKADSLDEKINVGDGEIDREIEDNSNDPQRVFDKKDTQQAVQRAISSLSEEHRAVVVLHHIEGMDVKDIARVLNMPVGTIKSRLARARDELKRKLGHYVA